MCVEIDRPACTVYACASMDLCVHAPPPSLLSATRMSVLHMYVSSDHSVKRGEERRRGRGEGAETPIHVYISPWVTEQLRPEVRKKRELHCFWEEVIDES